MGRTDMRRVVLAVTLLAPLAQGATWRCVDARGGVLYTDVPCAAGEIVADRADAGKVPPTREAPPIDGAAARAGTPAPGRPARATKPPVAAEFERYGWSPSATLSPWPPPPVRETTRPPVSSRERRDGGS